MAGSRAKASGMGELFRDMSAASIVLAKEDTTTARPYLNASRLENAATRPTPEKFYTVWKQGHKTRIRLKFQETLELCATQNGETLDQLITILGSPISHEATRFFQFGVGLDQFQIHGFHEMTLSRCTSFWKDWLETRLSFYEPIMTDILTCHFDSILQDALVALGARNDTKLADLFWPIADRECSNSPIAGASRNPDILPLVDE